MQPALCWILRQQLEATMHCMCFRWGTLRETANTAFVTALYSTALGSDVPNAGTSLPAARRVNRWD